MREYPLLLHSNVKKYQNIYHFRFELNGADRMHYLLATSLYTSRIYNLSTWQTIIFKYIWNRLQTDWYVRITHFSTPKWRHLYFIQSNWDGSRVFFSFFHHFLCNFLKNVIFVLPKRSCNSLDLVQTWFIGYCNILSRKRIITMSFFIKSEWPFNTMPVVAYANTYS